jgi:5-methylcytosine-specific restriction endonuclease McrA
MEHASNFKSLIDQKFNRLTVMEFAGRYKSGNALWLCRCDCGNEKIVCGSHLRNGHTKSCGCLAKEILFQRCKNKNLSEETKRKISENHADFRREKSPNWNPNITDKERRIQRKYPEYYEWHKAIYERDNYTCQICDDNKGGNLVAHHLESYDSNKNLRITLSNGITLCETCHKDFHHQYGYGNNTKRQFEEFIKEYNNGNSNIQFN